MRLAAAVRRCAVLLGMLCAAAAPMCTAQVIGVQPIPLAVYCWNSSTGEWEVATNTSTAEPSQFTPQPTAMYGFNASLGQWTPFVASAGSCATGGGGSGSVTSVGLSLPTSIFMVTGSPVTSTGTLTAALVSQNADTFFAGPVGTAGTPVFRLLTATDVAQAGTLSNNISGNAATATGLATNLTSAAAAFYPMLAPLADTSLGQTAQVASNLSFDPFTSTLTVGTAPTGHTVTLNNLSTIPASWTLDLTSPATACSSIGCSTGTVTSVALTMPATQFTVTGSPITSSGTFNVTLNSPTGTGAIVLASSPTLVTPTIGAATATSILIGGCAAGTTYVKADGSGCGTPSGAGTITGVTAGTGLTGGGTSGTVTVSLSTPVSAANGGTGANESAATGVGQWASGAYSVSTALANGTTATTQSTGDLSAKVTTDLFLGNTLASPPAIGSTAPAAGTFTTLTSTSIMVAEQSSSTNTALADEQTTVATSGSNFSSPFFQVSGNYWTGTATNQDVWDVQDVLSSGTNPISTLAFTHIGSSGASAVEVPTLEANSAVVTTTASAAGFIAAGTQSLSVSGTGCALSAESGGAAAGTFTLANPDSTACVLTVTLPTAPHGWMCTAPNGDGSQTASTTTSAALTFNEAATGQVWFSCTGY